MVARRNRIFMKSAVLELELSLPFLHGIRWLRRLRLSGIAVNIGAGFAGRVLLRIRNRLGDEINAGQLQMQPNEIDV